MPEYPNGPLLELAVEAPYLGVHHALEEATNAARKRPEAFLFDLDGGRWRYDAASESLVLTDSDPDTAIGLAEKVSDTLREWADTMVRRPSSDHPDLDIDPARLLASIASRLDLQFRLIVMASYAGREPPPNEGGSRHGVGTLFCKLFPKCCDDG